MARRDVFVDTSGYYALIDKRDAEHARARAMVQTVARQGRKLVVTDYVVSETVTLARARSGTNAALRVLDLIEQSVVLRVERIDAARFDDTRSFFRKHADRDYSFADCASFVVMRELGLRQALTTDGHFHEAGFEALLPVR